MHIVCMTECITKLNIQILKLNLNVCTRLEEFARFVWIKKFFFSIWIVFCSLVMSRYDVFAQFLCIASCHFFDRLKHKFVAWNTPSITNDAENSLTFFTITISCYAISVHNLSEKWAVHRLFFATIIIMLFVCMKHRYLHTYTLFCFAPSLASQ